MTVRYRILRSSLDWDEIAAVERSSSRGDSSLAEAIAIAGAPRRVTWAEGRVEDDAIEGLVERGVLGERDLVDLGEGWACVEDYPRFDHALAVAYHSSTWRARLGIWWRSAAEERDPRWILGVCLGAAGWGLLLWRWLAG